MGQIIDLRKYNIKSDDDVVEFLELFVTKAPQIISHLKRQKLNRISLQNRLAHAVNNQAEPVASQVVDESASVLDRLTGQNKAAVPTAAQGRLAQLKAAQNAPAVETNAPAAPAEPVAEADDLPPAPVAPGEIGQLNVPTVNPQAPVLAGEPENPLAAPDEVSVQDEVQVDGVSQGEVEQAAGSKSERSADDGVQQEDTELTDEEKAALMPSQPTEADKTSIGTRIAKKTDNGKKSGKRK